jgi:hypothetical protein
MKNPWLNGIEAWGYWPVYLLHVNYKWNTIYCVNYKW